MDFNELDLSILKTILTNRKHSLEFVHECNEKLFSPDLWRFAKTIIDYIRIYKDVPTKRVIFERVQSLKNETFLEHVNAIFSKLETFTYDDREYAHDLEKLKSRFSEKLILNLKDNLVNTSGSIDIKKSVNEIQAVLSHIQNINKPKAYEQKTLKDSMDDFKNRYIAKLKDPNFGIGLTTGYSFFDFTTGGLRPGEMLLVGADTGGGKSMLLMNMAINMWLQGNTMDMTKDFKEGCDILYFSLEMPHDDCLERVLARLGMIPQKEIRDAKLDSEKQTKLSKTMNFIKNYPWDLDIIDVPRGASIETIELIFNDVVQRRRKPKIVVIDYLTLMDYHKESDLDDWLKQGKISEQLHEFGRVHEVVMLSAVQLNDSKMNGGKSTESKIGLHRIGRSKMIMHNANFGIQIEKRPDEEQCPDMNLHLIKSRRTELARGKIHKNFSCCALLNDPYIYSEETHDPDDISNKMLEIDRKI
jgi:hypothetical protein